MPNSRHLNAETGKKLLSWKAPDFHPYQRGFHWYMTFCALTFGSALFIFWLDPANATVPVVSICVLAAFYLWVHKSGEQEISIALHENGLLVSENNFLPWSQFRGFWVLEDKVSRLLVLEGANWKQGRVRLQLGKVKTDRLLKVLASAKDLAHLSEQKECAFDLWSRVFRL